jgi:hypothetical protein
MAGAKQGLKPKIIWVRCGTTKEAAEKVRMDGKDREKHASGAKAPPILLDYVRAKARTLQSGEFFRNL